jgi:hypothetical protein
MGDISIAQVTLNFYKTPTGDLEVRPEQPVIGVVSEYDYVRLSLVLAEVLQAASNQTTVVNVDQDNAIYKLSEVVIDKKGYAEAIEARKNFENAAGNRLPDTVTNQIPLPFKEREDKQHGNSK